MASLCGTVERANAYVRVRAGTCAWTALPPMHSLGFSQVRRM